MTPTIRTATFTGRYDSLRLIAAFVRKAAEDAGLDTTSVYMVETAVDEACSNIIEHAYGGEDIGDIEITCQIHPYGLKVILLDYGKSFNPGEIPEPKIDVPLEERESHGLGLFFMQKMMDEIQFEFSEENGNVLSMTKFKEKKAG
ncbi:MAG: ATP-binding protein [Chloroflexi bacterium]|nr:ATP-binding protein [Anaerolineaceae bacterium]NMB90172.1 ATP-binding protein [Chloroflexota bacterium]